MKATKLRDMTMVELDRKVDDLKQELFNLRFQLATGQLDNTARIKDVKRDIARTMTVKRERELQKEA